MHWRHFLSVWSLQSQLLLFLDKRDNFPNKTEEFYNLSIKKILVSVNGMPHQLFAAGLQEREIYSELKKCFYKENSDVTWEDFFTTKFAIWIDTRSSTNNTLHGSGRQWKKVVYYFRSKKHLKPAVILQGTYLALKMQDPSKCYRSQRYLNN